ncbi:MAG: XTP/dITP diphosphatase [Candidatus Desantisbacteria bacterium]
MKLVIASRNKGKIEEIKKYLSDTPIEVVSLSEYPAIPEVIEDGHSFEENAAKKAIFVAEYTQEIALSDDSGLEVDCLHGEPGVLSARFGGDNLDDNGRNQLLLERMKNIPLADRTAHFTCAIAIVDPEGWIKIVKGQCQGSIDFVQRGEQGFGYDPVFIPTGYTATFAELGIEEKNKFSHRAKALEKARDVLKREMKIYHKGTKKE